MKKYFDINTNLAVITILLLPAYSAMSLTRFNPVMMELKHNWILITAEVWTFNQRIKS
ncbi:MAG: hypothetical protein U1E01_07620 [Methylicorpusculum sp.]|nr:hypothetical protein [Methylicorpusculum sp.]